MVLIFLVGVYLLVCSIIETNQEFLSLAKIFRWVQKIKKTNESTYFPRYKSFTFTKVDHETYEKSNLACLKLWKVSLAENLRIGKFDRFFGSLTLIFTCLKFNV